MYRSAGRQVPGPILLLGAPGVGKGTQAKLLMGEFDVPQISTGDILRDQIQRSTELGKTARSLMDRGELVPDDLVNGMVGDRLAQQDVVCGYVLDGFPRTIKQAKWLDDFLTRADGRLDLLALSLHVDEAELLRRITGRRTCSECGHIYNIYSQKPQADGVCDVDGSALQQRSDDTEEAFEERMKAYLTSTAPVIEHYRAKGRFAEVDGMQAADVVRVELRDSLARMRGWGA